MSLATWVCLNSWSLFLRVSSQTLTILTICAVVRWKPCSLALIRMAAPHRELGLRPYSIQSWRMRLRSRLAVSSTWGCNWPNSRAEQKRRMNTQGSIRGRSLCRNFTSFRKQAPNVYRFIWFKPSYMQRVRKVNQQVRFVPFPAHDVQTGCCYVCALPSLYKVPVLRIQVRLQRRVDVEVRDVQVRSNLFQQFRSLLVVYLRVVQTLLK